MKRILVIEGGGADGLLALGALQYLINNKHKGFDEMYGTSIGGVLCLGLGCLFTKHNNWHVAVSELKNRFCSLSKWDLIKRPSFSFLWSGGYLVSNIKEAFEKKIGYNNIDIPCHIAITDIDSKNPVRFIRSGIYKPSEMAAMTANIPGVFSHYKDPITGHRIYDGGVACNNAIAEACKNNEKSEITLIRLASYKPSKGWFNTPIQNLYNLFSLTRAHCENLSIKISKLYEQLQPNMKITTIEFHKEIGLLSFDPSVNRGYVNEGFRLTRQKLSNII